MGSTVLNDVFLYQSKSQLEQFKHQTLIQRQPTGKHLS